MFFVYVNNTIIDNLFFKAINVSQYHPLFEVPRSYSFFPKFDGFAIVYELPYQQNASEKVKVYRADHDHGCISECLHKEKENEPQNLFIPQNLRKEIELEGECIAEDSDKAVII